jgi:hypothetical protein
VLAGAGAPALYAYPVGSVGQFALPSPAPAKQTEFAPVSVLSGVRTVPFTVLHAATASTADFNVVEALETLPLLVVVLSNSKVTVAKMTIIAITTKISIKVKPFLFCIVLRLLRFIQKLEPA